MVVLQNDANAVSMHPLLPDVRIQSADELPEGCKLRELITAKQE